MQDLAYQSPHLCGVARSRWHLPSFRDTVPWMRPLSLSGVSRLLKRLKVVYKRGRQHVHSPDGAYRSKLTDIQRAQASCLADPEHVVFLYEDEHTVYRNPSLSFGYATRGGAALTAEQATGFNAMRRIAGCLNWRTGAVHVRYRSQFNVKEMGRFFRWIDRLYPDAHTIYMALDNWPVHFHEDVQQYVREQGCRIVFLRLPTYAPWTNPIEKLWRKWNQDIYHQHPWSADFEVLKQVMTEWFGSYEYGSQELLHYVGLNPSFPKEVPKLIC